MDSSSPAAPLRIRPELSVVQLAQAALRRLASEQLEPTPENYARAYRHEGGALPLAAVLPARAQRLLEVVSAAAFAGASANEAAQFCKAMAHGRWGQAEQALEAAVPASAESLAVLIERIIRGFERGGQHWTAERRKEGIQRVLSGSLSLSDSSRLQVRLSSLLSSLESEGARGIEAVEGPPMRSADEDWPRAVSELTATVRQALPACDGARHELADAFDASLQQLFDDGASGHAVDELQTLCRAAAGVLQQRNQLFDQFGELCRELTASLADLAEDDSWVRGQCDAMRVQLDGGLTTGAVRTVAEMLRNARARHAALRREREQARDALKALINRMLSELAELGSKTGHFHESVGRYAAVIEGADTLESLTGVVREMVEESRTVQSLVQQAQQRLQDEHAKASDLSQRVDQLEGEMQRLSDEASTDHLTQIANRRGLMQAFDSTTNLVTARATRH